MTRSVEILHPAASPRWWPSRSLEKSAARVATAVLAGEDPGGVGGGGCADGVLAWIVAPLPTTQLGGHDPFAEALLIRLAAGLR